MNYEFIFTTYPNVVLVVKKLPANAGIIGDTEFSPWAGKIPWRRAWEPTPVFLPGEFRGLRSLAGYSPWGHKESDFAGSSACKESTCNAGDPGLTPES